jgi:hypothetical protein
MKDPLFGCGIAATPWAPSRPKVPSYITFAPSM